EGRPNRATDGAPPPFPRRAGPRQVFLDPASDLRERLAEGDHPAVLRLVADLAPAGVVPVLLASLAVPAARLQVGVRQGTDHDDGPGRTARQGSDAGEVLGGAQGRPIGRFVSKALAVTPPPD